MIFINSYEEEINVDEILESFRIITEAFEDVDDIIGFCEENGFSDDDKVILKDKIDEYIEKSKEISKKARKDHKSSAVFIFIGLGLNLLGACIMLNFPIASLVLQLIGLINYLISIVKSTKMITGVSKIRTYISNLKRMKEKANSEKDKERIQRVIDKLEILARNTSVFYKKRDVE